MDKSTKMASTVMAEREEGESVLDVWKRTQPLPEYLETLEMGTISAREMETSDLLYWKVQKKGTEECAVILAVHRFTKRGRPGGAILPLGVEPFPNPTALHLFIAGLKQKALESWTKQWWRES